MLHHSFFGRNMFDIKHFHITYRVGNNMSGVAICAILHMCNSHHAKGLALFSDRL